MAGDAGADSIDEIFAAVLCFNMGGDRLRWKR